MALPSILPIRAQAAHDEAAAEKALRQALEALGIGQGELEQMPKSAPEKMVLAWWLRKHTIGAVALGE